MPKRKLMPSQHGRRARLLLGLILLSSACASLGMQPLGARTSGKVPLIKDQFVAPQGVVRVAWRRTLQPAVPFFSYHPQEFASAAASADGQLVFIGSSEKTFYAMRARDGEVVWKRELTGEVSSQPLVLPAGAVGPESLVLVGDDDGVLSAIVAATGAVRWTYRARGPIHTQPVVHGGLVYITSSEGRVYGLDLRTGKWVWQYEREIPEGFAIRGSSGVLPVGTRVFVGFPDGYLACLNGENGEVVWTRQLSGESSRFTDVDGTPAVFGDTLYVTCYSGGVYALDVKDGSTRWRFDLEAAGPLAVDPSGERIYAVSANQGLYCLDSKGRKLWQQAFPREGELSQPLLWGNYLVLSAAADGLHILDKRTGELLQFFDPGQGATARPATQGEHLYILSNAGAFFALTTR
jgi:outer membrane protein assembly factor BamB